MLFLWLLIAQISLTNLPSVKGNDYPSNCSAVGVQKIYISWSIKPLNNLLNYSYSVFFCKNYDAHQCYNKFKLGCVVNSSKSSWINTCDIGKALQLKFPREFKFMYYIRVDDGLAQEEGEHKECHVNMNMRCTDPRGLSVNATRKRTLTLKWLPPSDMGELPDLCYKIIHSEYGSNIKSKYMMNVENFSYTINALLPYARYTIWLQCALDCTESSYWSNMVGPVIARTREEIPQGTVQILEYKIHKEDNKPSRNFNVTIYFKLPSKKKWNGNITYIKMYCYKGSTLCDTKKVPPHRKVISFHALERDTVYSLQAEYCNNEGCSKRSHNVTVQSHIQKSQQMEPKTSNDKGTENIKTIIIIGASIGCVIVVIIVCAYIYKRCRSNPNQLPLNEEVGDIARPLSESDNGDEAIDPTNSEYASVCEVRSRTTLNADTTDFQSASARSLDSFNIGFADQSSVQNEPIQLPPVGNDSLLKHCEEIELTEVTTI